MEIKAKEREMKNGFLLTVSDESGSQPTQNCSWSFSSDISVIFLAADILSHSLVCLSLQ
jgi:hypothetical protein